MLSVQRIDPACYRKMKRHEHSLDQPSVLGRVAYAARPSGHRRRPLGIFLGHTFIVAASPTNAWTALRRLPWHDARDGENRPEGRMSTDASSPQGSPFWRFSLAYYRDPRVADACIALQEEAGVDVNLLLFLLWHAAQSRRFSTAEVEELEGRVGPWREAAVVPLRRLRRALKVAPPLLSAANAEAFRTRIKAVELEAERLQQEAMYDLVRSGLRGSADASVAAAARANVAAYQTICRAPFPPAAVETLLAALSRRERTAQE
jgi:uncharacterized protein (TIGR02444 family)